MKINKPRKKSCPGETQPVNKWLKNNKRSVRLGLYRIKHWAERPKHQESHTVKGISGLEDNCFSRKEGREKAMAPHSSTLAWKIPWTEEPGRLQSMGSLRVRHNWVTSLSLFTFMHWRRKWQPTPVFLPQESQGWGSLVGCRLWGCTESDKTEVT